MQRDKICIGLPVYNAAATLGRSIDTLRNQTFKNIEICISDNASTDGSLDIIKAAAADPRIRWVSQNKNRGICNNFLAVAEMATGEYFCWAASDDQYKPQFLEELHRALAADNDALCAMCASSLVNERGEQLRTVRYTGRDNPNELNGLQQAARLISANPAKLALKYNFFIMGLYRTSFLKTFLSSGPETIFLGDRVIPAAAALAGRLTYINHPYYIRTQQGRAFRDRHPDDPFIESEKLSPWRYAQRVLRLMLSSSALPITRKPLAVLLLSSYFLRSLPSYLWRLLRSRVVKRIDSAIRKPLKRWLPEPILRTLRKVLFRRA